MILVVGATGYVGRYLCPYLKNKGYGVNEIAETLNIKSGKVSVVRHRDSKNKLKK